MPRCARDRQPGTRSRRRGNDSAVCGIYGILQLDGAPAAVEDLQPMGRVTIHRGPDDEGAHADGPLAFGMRRLSIIDLDGGHQPLSNEDGTLWLVANGEIYNYLTLRRELTAQGHRFKTGSDCETDSSPLRGARRRICPASEWHVCLRAVGCAPAPIARRPRPARRKADLPAQRRQAPAVRQRGQGDSRRARHQGGARSVRTVVLSRSRICARAAVDLRAVSASFRRQHCWSPKAGASRSVASGTCRRESITRCPRMNGPTACARGSRNRCACKW